MTNKTNKLGFVLSSSYRTALVKIMDNKMSVSAVLWKKAREDVPRMGRSDCSRCLSAMDRAGVLKCVNPEEKLGRVYKLTPLGAKLRKIITQKIGGEKDVSYKSNKRS